MSDLLKVLHAVDRLQKAEQRVNSAVDSVRTANRELGNALRFYRQQKAISLRAVAARLKLSAPFLSDCELGRRTLSDKHREQYLDFLQPGRNIKIRYRTKQTFPRDR